MTEPRLPPGIVPRLLSREAATTHWACRQTISRSTSLLPPHVCASASATSGTPKARTDGLINSQVSPTVPAQSMNQRGCWAMIVRLNVIKCVRSKGRVNY
jgi:hypothetical protein